MRPSRRAAKRERDLVVAPLRLRVGPHGGLLGAIAVGAAAAIGGYRKRSCWSLVDWSWKAREQGIVSTHAARGAVLYGEAGVAIEDRSTQSRNARLWASIPTPALTFPVSVPGPTLML